jgi:hypothetical protein
MAGVAVLIARHGVNVPLFDEWGMSVRAVVGGWLPGFEFDRFWALHNEHRMFVPWVAGTLLGHITALDMRALLWLSYALAILEWSILCLLWRKTAGTRDLWMAVPFAWLVFSLAGGYFWIDPRAPYAYFTVTSILAALLAANGRESWGRLATSIAMCVVAALSHFPGTVLWVVVPFVMAVSGWRRPSSYLIFFGVGLIIVGSHVVDLLESRATLLRGGGLPNPVKVIDFVVLFVGGPFAKSLWLIRSIGALAITGTALLAVQAIRSVGAKAAAPWIGFAAVMLGSFCAAASGPGRTALASRYGSYASVVWAAPLALAGLCALASKSDGADGRRQRRGRFALVAFAVLLMTGVGARAGYVLNNGVYARFESKANESRKCIARTEKAPTKCLNFLHSRPKFVRDLVRGLRDQDIPASFLDLR